VTEVAAIEDFLPRCHRCALADHRGVYRVAEEG
jgi:hypothetical protein